MNNLLPALITALLGVIIGSAGVWISLRSKANESRRIAEEAAERARLADQESEARKKEVLLEAKEEIHRLRQELEEELKEQRQEIKRQTKRLAQREENLDRRQGTIEKQERQSEQREQELAKREQQIAALREEQRAELERVSSLSSDEARELLMKRVEEETQYEMVQLMKQIEEQARGEAERKARNIISLAIARCAVDQAAESTVSVVPLPSDEMKGRIIGREGRNIRAFESLTGVDLIIDDTPEAVVISGFDPIRREIARTALASLITDGRIHPARIEELVNKARREIEEHIRQEAERAQLETGVSGLPGPLAEMVGKLTFRTSYGQNCLNHSIEVSHIAAIMAAEINADVRVARRAGLLHDVGKASTHEQEGTHLEIGLEMMRRHNESTEVIHAVECHHGDVEPHSVEAVLVQAADAISASRPGARREMLETYIKRLERLEDISESFEGVDQAFAIQAGREVRIIVKPDEVDDILSLKLARDIAARIEQELQYPGEIRVTVVRETRATATAR